MLGHPIIYCWISLPLLKTTPHFAGLLFCWVFFHLLNSKFPLSRNCSCSSIQHSRAWISQLRHTGSAAIWMLMGIQKAASSPFKLYSKTVLRFPFIYSLLPTFWGDLTNFGSTWKLLDCQTCKHWFYSLLVLDKKWGGAAFQCGEGLRPCKPCSSASARPTLLTDLFSLGGWSQVSDSFWFKLATWLFCLLSLGYCVFRDRKDSFPVQPFPDT